MHSFLLSPDEDSLHRNASYMYLFILMDDIYLYVSLLFCVGILYLNALLDQTKVSQINCKVFAYSSDKVANKSNAVVNITVIPNNNEPPKFKQVSVLDECKNRLVCLFDCLFAMHQIRCTLLSPKVA